MSNLHPVPSSFPVQSLPRTKPDVRPRGVQVVRIRWPEQRLLEEARQRTKAMAGSKPAKVQHMLEVLLAEAGWSGEEFIDVLCSDVVARTAH